MRTCLAIVLLVTWSVGSGRVASAQPAGAEAVVDEYERALGAGDVDRALALFADDAIVSIRGATTQSFVGREQILLYLQTIRQEFRPIMHSVRRVEAVQVSWTERDQGTTQSVDAIVQVVVFSGQIISVIYRTGDPFGAPAPRAVQPAPQPRELPSAIWPAALTVVSVAVLAFLSRRPRRARSHLDGQLITSMQRARQAREGREAA